MKDLSVCVEQISSVLQKFVSTTHLRVTFRLVPDPGRVPDLYVEFGGADADWLLGGDSELLRALEDLASAIRSPELSDQVVCRVVSGTERE